MRNLWINIRVCHVLPLNDCDFNTENIGNYWIRTICDAFGVFCLWIWWLLIFLEKNRKETKNTPPLIIYTMFSWNKCGWISMPLCISTYAKWRKLYLHFCLIVLNSWSHYGRNNHLAVCAESCWSCVPVAPTSDKE